MIEPATATKTASWLKRLWGWFRDFGAAPSNLRKLVEVQQIDKDRRLHCLSCGVGRVGDLSLETKHGFASTTGRCDSCGLRWYVNVKAGVLDCPRPDHF